MSHAALAAARANFHNQSIVANLPADASAKRERQDAANAAAGGLHDGNSLHLFRVLFRRDVVQAEARRPGGRQ